MQTPALYPLASMLCLMVTACTTDEPVADPRPMGNLDASTLTETSNTPHIVLVTIDTLRADYLGAYGGPAHTPVMDRMAKEGWLFEECISASMLTNPSHASIMTSLYPRDHGVYDNESGIKNGMGTLASALKKSGFQTGAVIGFPHLNPEVANLGQGFGRIITAPKRERRAAQTTQTALKLLDQMRADSAANNTFMWVHYTDPHAPYAPPQSYTKATYPSIKSVPMARALRAAPSFQKNNPWFKKALRKYKTTRPLIVQYIKEIEAVDAGIKSLLLGLQSRLGDNFAVVLTSDHGENLGEHRLFFHHGGLYRATTHVPLMIWKPNMHPYAKRFSDQVATIDIAPTILEMAGVQRWEPMRGRSLLGMVHGVEQGREFTFSEHLKAQLVSVQSREGTLILHRKSTRQFPSYPIVRGRREMFVTTNTPNEPHVLKPIHSNTRPKLTAKLDAALQQYLGLGLQLTARKATTQDRASLRALGYVE